MKETITEEFKKRVEIESTYRKFIKKDNIYKLINIFSVDAQIQEYSKEISNPIELVLRFYKEYNEAYYNLIMSGIENKTIIFSSEKGKPYCDDNGVTFIRLYGNDSDVFIIAHELAHYIDINSKHKIIPNDLWYFKETFAFYMEKRLEQWLKDNEYQQLIRTRKNNRIALEKKMLKAIENELYYEYLYVENGQIEDQDLDIDEVNGIMKYDVQYDIVNNLLAYPMANILSDFLINANIKNDRRIVDACLGLNLDTYLANFDIQGKKTDNIK